MRLIDADALKEALKEPILMDKERAEALWEGWHECTVAVNKAIDNTPTVQPERLKGEWIPAFDGAFTGGVYWFECSECKRIVPEVRNGGWNFCPSCGAYMIEGGNDEVS